MNIEDYISKQSIARQNILTEIHKIIIEEDRTVKAGVEKMMGKEMVIYKGNGVMKYGLASVKNYMSLHLLPIYGSNTLYTKYKTLLNKASFQKGCINFDSEDKMPLDIVRQLIVDCAPLDLKKIKEEYIKQKRIKS
jgi:hypothetical protein